MIHKNKQFALLLCLILSSVWCCANGNRAMNEFLSILINEAQAQGYPRSSSIHAYIDGHYLMIGFTENIGQVEVEVSSVPGGVVQNDVVRSPDGMQYYIPLTGDYIVTFTLADGDMYYGEFSVTD